MGVSSRFDFDDAIRQGQELGKELGEEIQIRDMVVTAIYGRVEEIVGKVAPYTHLIREGWDRRIDNVLTSRLIGYPLMLGLLGFVLWLTITGANYPSSVLASLFSVLENQLTALFFRSKLPVWLHGVVVLGTYRGLAWVVSVMLPPMAIFFPLFTLLRI